EAFPGQQRARRRDDHVERDQEVRLGRADGQRHPRGGEQERRERERPRPAPEDNRTDERRDDAEQGRTGIRDVVAVRRQVDGEEERAEADRAEGGEAQPETRGYEQHREPEAPERAADMRERAQLVPLSRSVNTRSLETLPARSTAPTATWPLRP